MDLRIHHLEQSLRSAVIDTQPGPADVVRFGSTVRVREVDGTEERFRIVGVDEADAGLNWISWQSPLARTLLQARVGDRVSLQAPRGRRELLIAGIE
jgi:transcription elongation factor GreB